MKWPIPSLTYGCGLVENHRHGRWFETNSWLRMWWHDWRCGR